MNEAQFLKTKREFLRLFLIRTDLDHDLLDRVPDEKIPQIGQLIIQYALQLPSDWKPKWKTRRKKKRIPVSRRRSR